MCWENPFWGSWSSGAGVSKSRRTGACAAPAGQSLLHEESSIFCPALAGSITCRSPPRVQANTLAAFGTFEIPRDAGGILAGTGEEEGDVQKLSTRESPLMPGWNGRLTTHDTRACGCASRRMGEHSLQRGLLRCRSPRKYLHCPCFPNSCISRSCSGAPTNPPKDSLIREKTVR